MGIARGSAPSVLFLGAFLILPGLGGAQTIPSPYRFIEKGQEVTFLATWFDAAPGRFGLGPEPGVLYGGRYGVELSGPLAMEGTLGWFSTTRDVVNPILPEETRVVDEAEVVLGLVDVRLRFALTGRRTWNRLSPYLVTGGGVIFDASGNQEEDQRLDEEDRFSFGTGFQGVFGGGTRLFLTDRLALRTEATLTLYKLDIPQGWQETDTGVPEDEWVSAGALTAGLSFLF